MIGDVVLSTALIKNLRHYYPDAHIAVATYDYCAPVLKHNPDINEIIIYKKEKSFFKYSWFNFKFFTSFLFKKFDLYICLRDNSRARYLGLLSRCKTRIAAASIKKRFKNWVWTYSDFPSKPGQHAIDFDLHALSALGHIPVSKDVTLVEGTQHRKNILEKLPKQYIHIHPVARWEYKEIELEKLALAIDWLAEKNVECVITSSPASHEMEKVATLVNACNSSPINLSGQIKLEEMVTVCKNARLYLGPDTAVMHMAAALNTPVLAWFGPSLTSHWGPWDNQLSDNPYHDRGGVQHGGIHTIIQLKMDCVPCGKKGCDDSGESQCLKDLSGQQIIEQLAKKLNLDEPSDPVINKSQSKQHPQKI